MLPSLDIAPLLGSASVERDRVDAQIMDHAGDLVFLQITGSPGADLIAPANRDRLKTIFAAPAAAKRRMMRVNFNPENANVYRGWYPLQPGLQSYKEGIDVGPDVARDALVTDDPLREPTPLPTEEEA